MSKRMFTVKVRQLLWAGTVALLVARAGAARANNFNVYADKNGCESILSDPQRTECRDVQAEKNKACNIGWDCDVGKQERTIEKYKEAQKRLDERTVPDADRERLGQTIAELKNDLDERKATADKGMEIASNCIKARANVQEWFEKTAIPLTANLRDAALAERKDLISKLEEAQKNVREAKEKRDAKPDDSNLRSEWEKANDALRGIEKQLEDFNSKYGVDIEYNANRLIKQYTDEKTRHDTPAEQAENRLESCKKLAQLSY